MPTPCQAAAEGMLTHREIAEAYRQWLHMEGRLLGIELYPECGGAAPDFIPMNTLAHNFHFPRYVGWEGAPKPSTRAEMVLRLVGAIPTEHDPMIALIAEYRRQVAIYNEYPDDWTSEQADAFADETFEPCLSRLENDTPVITTEKGAVEAIRLALEEPPASGMTKSILAAALTYFDGRA